MKISEITNEVTTPSGADLVEMETAGGTSGKVKIRNLVGIVPVRTVASSTVIALTDVGGTVRMNSGSATNFTVANNSSVAAPIGSVINVRKVGSGNVTIVADSGVTVNNNTVLSGTFENAALHKIGTNEWDLIISAGSGETGGGGDTTAPTIVSAATNGAGTQVTITFSETMNSPTASGWTFKINGVATSITNVIQSAGIMYIFTLGGTVANGDTVTYSYNGATGDAADTSGNELANVTDLAVTNNVSGGGAALPHTSNFTAANGVDLVDYTPDAGNAWTPIVSSALEIQSNRLTGKTDGGSGFRALVDIGATDCTITAIAKKGTTADALLFYVKATDSSNSGLVLIDSGNASIYDLVGGSATAINPSANSTWANDTNDHTWGINVAGNVVTITLDGVQIKQETLTGTYTGTKVGLGMTGAVGGASFDSFLVVA